MTNNVEKITKREKYVALVEFLKTGTSMDVEANAMFIELCEGEIAAIDKKAAKAKERAAEKKTETDELYDKVETVVRSADGAVSINDIVLAIGEDATAAKVVNRLKKMVDAGLVEKATATEDKRRINVYKWN